MPPIKPKKVINNNKPKFSERLKKTVQLIKDTPMVVNRISKTKNPAQTLFRLNRYKLYTTAAKHYPKASEFYSEVFRRLDKKDGVKFFMWLPGIFYVGPFTLRFRFRRTERIISDLEKRNIPINKIINNERVSMSIAQYGIFNYKTTKSKAYEAYLSKLENIIKNNK